MCLCGIGVIWYHLSELTRRTFISLVSKVEGWLMAHLEATLMHTTNNHFKTLFSAICGFTGSKTLKIRPKKG